MHVDSPPGESSIYARLYLWATPLRCHPERSEGSLNAAMLHRSEILPRFARQNDNARLLDFP